jgi:hypothetical protein
VTVIRDDDEFFSLSGARRDGRSFTVNGSGVADITTPGTFVPGQSYAVTASAGNVTTSQRTTADGNGRLRITADLGQGEPVPEGAWARSRATGSLLPARPFSESTADPWDRSLSER